MVHFLRVTHLVWAAFLPGLWSRTLVSFSLPFIGCFLSIMFGMVSSMAIYRHSCFRFCEGGRSSHHPQEDKFGYRSDRKVETFSNPNIFWRHARTQNLLSKSGYFKEKHSVYGPFFSPKQALRMSRTGL